MSHAIDPEVGACIDKVGRVHLMVQNIETVRGSPHTPFDYGNKSVSRIAYEVVIPGANGKWTESDIQVFVAKFRQEKVKGTVANNNLSFDLFVSARDLPNYSLVPIRGVVAWRGILALCTKLCGCFVIFNMQILIAHVAHGLQR